MIRMAGSYRETRRRLIGDFQPETGADSAHRLRKVRHWSLVLLAALLIHVGTVAADDGLQESKLLDDLIIGFDFSEGQGATAHDVKKTGRNASLQHTVWLNDRTFGKVLNFSTATSSATLKKSVAVGETFTIAAWIKAPPRETDYRVIASQGKSGADDYWDIKLDRSTGRLALHAPALRGNTDSGRRLDDGLWHHVMVTYTLGTMQFYVDGKLVRESRVTGVIAPGTAALTIGACQGGRHSFDGSLARFRLFRGVKRPQDVTLIKPPGTADEPSTPRLKLKRGISIDRTQPKPRPLSTARMITTADVQLIKAMGFDHVKVLFTPTRFMTSDGGLNEDTLWHVERVVGTVLNQERPGRVGGRSRGLHSRYTRVLRGIRYRVDLLVLQRNLYRVESSQSQTAHAPGSQHRRHCRCGSTGCARIGSPQTVGIVIPGNRESICSAAGPRNSDGIQLARGYAVVAPNVVRDSSYRRARTPYVHGGLMSAEYFGPTGN